MEPTPVEYHHCEDKENQTSLTKKYKHHVKEIELLKKIKLKKTVNRSHS